MRNTRIKTIMEHNPDRRTDELYEPLRRAISRGSASKGKHSIRSQSPLQRQVLNSRITRKTHELNESQANSMSKGILIPFFKRLKPTGHLERVRGKNFTAIDANTKYQSPISESELKKRLRDPSVQETVYTIQSTPLQEQLSAYNSPYNELNIASVQGAESQEQENPFSIKQTNITKDPRSESREKLRRLTAFSQRNGDQYSSRIQSKLKQKFFDEQSNVTNQILKLRNKKKKSKPAYKYNLFSAIDAAVNSKCTTCGDGNQIIASKPRKQGWH